MPLNSGGVLVYDMPAHLCIFCSLQVSVTSSFHQLFERIRPLMLSVTSVGERKKSLFKIVMIFNAPDRGSQILVR